jgi:acyl-CoA reductase-like NAD-dependent aldehyde dehydrogenase
MRTHVILSPWTEKVVAELPVDEPAEVDAKLGRARTAQREWAEVPLADRVRLVERFVAATLADAGRVAREVTRQMGKPLGESRGEVRRLCERARMMCAIAWKALADEPVPIGDGITRWIVREPLGVLVDIAAWNYPLLIAGNLVVPGILAGNAVVLKHASQTALSGRWFEEAFRAVGAPEGLVTAVTLPGAETERLVQHPEVDAVFFTGSVPVGRQVYRAVGSRTQGFIDAGLELGGKDPAYVRADAPLEVVVPHLVEGAFYNAGQSCCAVERIYVARERYSQFVEAYVAEAKKWQVGDPEAEGTLMGPLATRETLGVLDAQVAEAVGRGARRVFGGSREGLQGWSYPATVVIDATHEMTLMTEESFGPVIGIAAVEGDEQAVAMMNDSPYGLTASIWTEDLGIGTRLAHRVSAGTVFVNRCDYVDPALPWTGLRDSGKGITLSHLGFDHLTRPRGLHLRPMAMAR